MVNLTGVFGILINIAAILIVLYVFEMTKAIASTIQGDTMPKENRMLTLNIFKYFEPIGFLLTFFFGYGWGRPAPVSSRNYKNRKMGMLITHLAPIIVAVILSIVIHYAARPLLVAYMDSMNSVMGLVYTFVVELSVYFMHIAIFNIIPIPPMCGYEILRSTMSPNAAFQFGQNAPLIQMGFLFLWFFGLITPLLDNVVSAFSDLLLR